MSRSDVQSTVRIILVGRTGLDAALRLDESFELARVRTPHDAIGELAHPIDEHSPVSTVVVVGGDIEAQLVSPLHEAPGRLSESRAVRADAIPIQGRERLVEFIRALRLVRPCVPILGVAHDRNGTMAVSIDANGLYDGVVDPTNASDDIKEACARGVENARASSKLSGASTPTESVAAAGALISMTRSAHEPPAVSASAPFLDQGSMDHNQSPSASPSANGSFPVSRDTAAQGDAARDAQDFASAPGDQALVEVAVRGQDVVPLALELLRHRVEDQGLAFVPPPAGKVAGGTGGPPQGVPVVWSDVVLGYLVPSRVGGIDLTAHARWLAGWIRLRDQHDQLRHAAFTDPLTSAWNRRYLDRFLASAIEAAREQRWSVTVLMFDIDDFKKYNDEYGHDAGDEILSEVVRLLRSVTRPTDKVCRIGGDEFAVIFHEPEGPRSPDSKHPTTVSTIIQRFQQGVNGHHFPKLSGCAPGTLTISGGLATFPWDGQTPADLLARADERTMQSKRQGKNAITIGPGAILKML